MPEKTSFTVLVVVVIALALATVGNLVATYKLTSMKSKVEAAFCIPAD
jgi:hypothetical protein